MNRRVFVAWLLPSVFLFAAIEAQQPMVLYRADKVIQ